MCLWREEEEHGEEEREAAAGLVTAAEEDRWDRSKRRAAVRGSEKPAAPRQAVLAGRQGPLSLLGCSPDLCPRGRGSFQFALCWIICFVDASFLVTLEMKTVEGDFGRV